MSNFAAQFGTEETKPCTHVVIPRRCHETLRAPHTRAHLLECLLSTWVERVSTPSHSLTPSSASRRAPTIPFGWVLTHMRYCIERASTRDKTTSGKGRKPPHSKRVHPPSATTVCDTMYDITFSPTAAIDFFSALSSPVLDMSASNLPWAYGIR